MIKGTKLDTGTYLDSLKSMKPGLLDSVQHLRFSNHNSTTFRIQPMRVMDLSLRTMTLCVWRSYGFVSLHRVAAPSWGGHCSLDYIDRRAGPGI